MTRLLLDAGHRDGIGISGTPRKPSTSPSSRPRSAAVSQVSTRALDEAGSRRSRTAKSKLGALDGYAATRSILASGAKVTALSICLNRSRQRSGAPSVDRARGDRPRRCSDRVFRRRRTGLPTCDRASRAKLPYQEMGRRAMNRSWTRCTPRPSAHRHADTTSPIHHRPRCVALAASRVRGSGHKRRSVSASQRSGRSAVMFLRAIPRRAMAEGAGSAFPQVRGPLVHWWQVKDSNLRSFRDGFTVHSHWPLGQPAWCAWKDSKDPRSRTGRPAPDRRHPGGHAHGRQHRSTSSARSTSRRSPTPSTAPRKEVATRYDFKNVGASIEASRRGQVIIKANTEERANAVLDVVQTWLVKRKVSLKHLDVPEARPAAVRQGVPPRASASRRASRQENAKKIGKIIRDEGPKAVKTQIQGDELRVTSKSRDDLQAVQRAAQGQGRPRRRAAVHQLPLSPRPPSRARRRRTEVCRRARLGHGGIPVSWGPATRYRAGRAGLGLDQGHGRATEVGEPDDRAVGVG